jgi:gas vesicle protein
MQHTNYDEREGAGFLMGLLCGAAVGAIAGLLFAPRSGAGMRAQVGETASKVGQRAKDTYQRASSAVSDMRNRAQDMGERFRRSGDMGEMPGNATPSMSTDPVKRMEP